MALNRPAAPVWRCRLFGADLNSVSEASGLFLTRIGCVDSLGCRACCRDFARPGAHPLAATGRWFAVVQSFASLTLSWDCPVYVSCSS